MINRLEKGFTLVELIVSIAILIILGAVFIPKIELYQAKAKKTKIQTSSKVIVDSIKSFNSDKKKRVLGSAVSLEHQVVDIDSVSTAIINAINLENGEVIQTSNKVYIEVSQLSVGQLVGISKGNFNLDSDGNVEVSSIVSGSIDN